MFPAVPPSSGTLSLQGAPDAVPSAAVLVLHSDSASPPAFKIPGFDSHLSGLVEFMCVYFRTRTGQSQIQGQWRHVWLGSLSHTAGTFSKHMWCPPPWSLAWEAVVLWTRQCPVVQLPTNLPLRMVSHFLSTHQPVFQSSIEGFVLKRDNKEPPWTSPPPSCSMELPTTPTGSYCCSEPL